MATRSISVILPVLNEENRIRETIACLHALDGQWHEILLVDGGSTDGTVAEAERAGGCRIVQAPRGRGSQLKAGALMATGDILLFLHADVSLPENAPALIRDTFDDPSVVAGAFKIRTVAETAETWWSFLIRLADLRSRYTRRPYGDQAVFCLRWAYDAAGGFPDQPLMEDVEFARRLTKVGKLARLDAEVRVSGRRFMARPIFYFLVMNTFPLLYMIGISPQRLERWYGHIR